VPNPSIGIAKPLLSRTVLAEKSKALSAATASVAGVEPLSVCAGFSVVVSLEV
jgi:hypothetical protein